MVVVVVIWERRVEMGPIEVSAAIAATSTISGLGYAGLVVLSHRRVFADIPYAHGG